MAKKLISKKGGVWQRLLDVLSATPGKLVPNQVIREAAGQDNYARRLRELRDEEGWDIEFHSKIPQGYILKSTKQKVVEEKTRTISLKLRQKVLERDNYTCQLCGLTNGDKYSNGRAVRLEVDHIIPFKNGGKTVEENLWVLCSQCNAGKKSHLAYPETLKSKIITLNLPDDIREEITKSVLNEGRSVNTILLEAIRRGLKNLD